MKKGILLLLLVLAAAGEYEISSAEIIKADIPDVELTPNLNSVLSLKNSIMPQRETQMAVNATSGAEETTGALAGVTTNGYILPNSSIIVDSLTEPKCIFYGNYNAGSGDAFQYLDINTITFECQ